MGIIHDKYQDDLPKPETDDVKEVFSFFGLASFWAQILERGFIMLAVGLSLSKTKTITKSELAKLWSEFEKRTLGILFNLVRKTTTLSKLTERISFDSLNKRNYLTHNFFWVHAENILTPKGRRIMLDELSEMTNLFRNADEAINKLSSKIMNEYGITEEDVQNEYYHMLERVKEKNKDNT